MASERGRKTASRAARQTERSAAEQSRAFASATNTAVAEGQRFLRAWTAAYLASVRGWVDLLRTSADTAANAAQAFDEAMR